MIFCFFLFIQKRRDKIDNELRHMNGTFTRSRLPVIEIVSIPPASRFSHLKVSQTFILPLSEVIRSPIYTKKGPDVTNTVLLCLSSVNLFSQCQTPYDRTITDVDQRTFYSYSYDCHRIMLSLQW